MIERRDFAGAATYIAFLRDDLGKEMTKDLSLWYAYCLFHHGDYSAAISVDERLITQYPQDGNLHLYLASCHYYNHNFEEAKRIADLGPDVDLRRRLLAHIAIALGEEADVFLQQPDLFSTPLSQLSLATMQYLCTSYDKAIAVYERMLLQNPTFVALHVYIAMCQFKSDHFYESNESIDAYLADQSDSAIGLNLKSCTYWRLFEPGLAEAQLL
jgi:intraflagellar transport protein 56